MIGRLVIVRSWRPLVGAALLLVGQSGVAVAQTLVLRNAPAATPIEVTYEGAVVGKGSPDPAGTAQIPLTLASGTTERVVQFHVDRCQGVVRVGVADRDRLVPAAGPECERQEVSGLFVVRRNTSLVLDMGQTTPMLLIRQGAPPAQWLRGDYSAETLTVVQPTGVNLRVGMTMPRIVKTFELACGDVAPCAGKDFKPTLVFGGTYWILGYAGAEVNLVKGATLKVTGNQENLAFTHELVTDVLTVGGNFGGLFGTVRVYARGGLAYHKGTTTIDQTLGDRSSTVGDVTTVITGGSQKMIVNTNGWGWMFGGGFEWWLKPPFGIYGEGTFTKLKGSDQAGGEMVLNERMVSMTLGGLVHLSNPFGRGTAAPGPTAPTR